MLVFVRLVVLLLLLLLLLLVLLVVLPLPLALQRLELSLVPCQSTSQRSQRGISMPKTTRNTSRGMPSPLGPPPSPGRDVSAV